ncbi:response regulator transcription factor [Blautia liquoris]|uniref:Stage 0 sporulation protein A homolog n=1 Tax=Blautia liquoris TaxID=2779518 RepID=A0A7M2RII3_9FIRM|nr:LytTR family DNA-binding domain-containing protein [Blautia liquoris]QOV19871.1 response regulator transcription factor [Blautia liquoris]
MLNIALCDDDRKAVSRYAGLIRQIAAKHQIPIEISYFDSGESLFQQYREKMEDLDIVYLDILMGGMNGMDTARKLRDNKCKAQIVFLTNDEECVYDAFEVSAIQYLVKEDTSFSKFERVFLKAAKLIVKRAGEMFTFEFDGTKGIVPIREISYFEIHRRLVTIHYGEGKTCKFYGNMSQLEEHLSKYNFIRAHRSFLIQLPYIAMFRQRELLLKTGEAVPIGNTYEQPLKEAFAGYISELSIYCEKETAL